MVSPKHAFWQALVFTLVIFALGLMFGFFIESYRSSAVQQVLSQSEVNLLDEQLRDSAFTNFNISCSDAVQSTFSFADRVYGEAVQLEQYDQATTLTAPLTSAHQRYDLLRLMLWTESSHLKKKCGNQTNIVVYLYDYNTDSTETKAEQNVYSSLLTDLKAKYPSQVLLIPMAANLNLDSITIAAKSYGINSYPAIIVNDRVVLTGSLTSADLENAIFHNNNA